MALRGDRNPDFPVKNDFAYADEMVRFIKTKGDFSISGGCYLEKHLEVENHVVDIRNLV